jgi:hypothetical protein
MSHSLPPQVYWVRRGLVLVGLVGVVLLVVLAVRAVAGAVSAAPPTTASPSPTSTLPGGIGDCDPAALRLGVSSAPSFPAGTIPTMNVTITNAGPDPCLVDAGEQQREIIITSGEDRIWSNRDCTPADAPARSLLLSDGLTDTQQVAWDRTRSAPGCPPDLPAPGAGTYVVSFTVGGAPAATAAFTME